MILRLFKSNQPALLFLIPVISAFFWFFPHTKTMGFSVGNKVTMPFYDLLTNIISPGSLASEILAIVLLLAIALYIVRLNTKYIIITERSYLPAIIYLMIFLGLYQTGNLSPVLPATLLFILAFDRLLGSYKSESLSYYIFDSALLIGLASLFYFSAIFFLLFIWGTIAVLRPFYWRELFFSILGIVLPYFMLSGYYYLTDKGHLYIFEIIEQQFAYQPWRITIPSQQFYTLILAIVFIIASLYILKTIGSKKIFARKTYNVLLITFINCIAIYLSVPSVTSEIIAFGAFPLSLLIAHLFQLAPTGRWLNLLFVLFISSFAIALIKFQLI